MLVKAEKKYSEPVSFQTFGGLLCNYSTHFLFGLPGLLEENICPPAWSEINVATL